MLDRGAVQIRYESTRGERIFEVSEKKRREKAD
jgi:hypothetical protein